MNMHNDLPDRKIRTSSIIWKSLQGFKKTAYFSALQVAGDFPGKGSPPGIRREKRTGRIDPAGDGGLLLAD
jgi:hypothetical protein